MESKHTKFLRKYCSKHYQFTITGLVILVYCLFFQIGFMVLIFSQLITRKNYPPFNYFWDNFYRLSRYVNIN